MRRFIISRALFMLAAMLMPWIYVPLAPVAHGLSTDVPTRVYWLCGIVAALLVAAWVVLKVRNKAPFEHDPNYGLYSVTVVGWFMPWPIAQMTGVQVVWLILAANVLVLAVFALSTISQVRKHHHETAVAPELGQIAQEESS